MAKSINQMKKEVKEQNVVKVSVKIKNMMKKVIAIQAQEALLKKQKDALKDEVKQFMKDNGLTEILHKEIKALYSEYTAEDFDKTLFKKERPKLYEQYTKQVDKTRFEIKDAKAGK